MARPRKLWATQPPLMKIARLTHPSRVAAYRNVQNWATLFRAGELSSRVTEIEVWVDDQDGRGWQLFERVNLADYGVEVPDGS